MNGRSERNPIFIVLEIIRHNMNVAGVIGAPTHGFGQGEQFVLVPYTAQWMRSIPAANASRMN